MRQKVVICLIVDVVAFQPMEKQNASGVLILRDDLGVAYLEEQKLKRLMGLPNFVAYATKFGKRSRVNGTLGEFAVGVAGAKS